MERKIIFAEAPASMAGEVLSDAQVCALLGCQTRTLRIWRRDRGLPYVKISRRSIRYRRQDIDQWMARQTVSIVA